MIELPSSAVDPGAVLPVDVDGDEYVLWRNADGRVRGAPRRCPHLDHDLADGYVVAGELVCAGHAWAFDGAGHAFKRNEFGRIDPKGTVETPMIRETDGVIAVEGS